MTTARFLPGCSPRCLRALCAGALCLGLLGPEPGAAAEDPVVLAAPTPRMGLAAAREAYEAAVTALSRGDRRAYRELRSGLDDYPLVPYLDYYELQGRLLSTAPGEARDYLQRVAGSPLENRFLARYLAAKGGRKRWSDLLAVIDEAPRSTELQCYYYRARLQRSGREEAFAGAARLWLHGRSQPDECDVLFERWRAAGGLTDELLWRRLLLAADSRQGGLMRYLGSFAGSRLRPAVDALLEAYRSPDRLDRVLAGVADERSPDVATVGIVQLARYRPDRALRWWLARADDIAFSAAQRAQIESTLAWRSALEQVADNAGWIDAGLDRWGDPALVELRLRWLLEERDWRRLLALLEGLDEAFVGDNRWLYWRAIALERTGEPAAARVALAAAAEERDYYGFLAAERAGLPLALARSEPDPPAAAAPPPVAERLYRVQELMWHREPQLAVSEWHFLLDRVDPVWRQRLALHAAARGWHRLAIDAINEAGLGDALALRFPRAHGPLFDAAAERFDVTADELLAIARRESAFHPEARSPAGARGLMQLLPRTAQLMAPAVGLDRGALALDDPAQNILLGSAYYRRLLDRFDGYRPLALAAYNAGPARVERWRRSSGGLPVDLWIETLPYRETRDYVKAVLAYAVIFAELDGRPAPLLSEREWLGAY